MSLEAIKLVVTAESDADQQRADAIAEAKRIVAAAEATGKEAVQKAGELATSQVTALCNDAEAKGKETAARAAEEIQAKCQALEDEAGARIDQAVTIIVERVVNGR